MTTIAHISDLHFGRLDGPVAEALCEELQLRRPKLLVVSGDLTQRGRRRQFKDAAAYLRRLPTPNLIVPGNHDVPMFDIFHRYLLPLHRFRKLIEPAEYPEYRDDLVYALGLNTARSFTITSGWLTPEQIAEAQRRFAAQTSGAGPASANTLLKILVTHHPFICPPDRPDADVLRGRAGALAELETVSVDLLLAGHLHLAFGDDVIARFPDLRRSVLSIQAGTACSNRLRSQPNSYNWITWDGQQLSSTVRSWIRGKFTDAMVSTYRRTAEGWECGPGTVATGSILPGPPVGKR